jgi:hypothetical protein
MSLPPVIDRAGLMKYVELLGVKLARPVGTVMAI